MEDMKQVEVQLPLNLQAAFSQSYSLISLSQCPGHTGLGESASF